MLYTRGDKVRIREWDDMLKDFGESAGDIRTPSCFFVDGMRRFCGQVLTIEDDYGGRYTMFENSYSWTDDMIDYKVVRMP